MRKIIFFVIIVCSIINIAGCDAVRKMAGRPTSEEIKQIAKELVAEQQHKLDSLRRVELDLRLSLEIADSARQAGGTILNESEIGGLFTTAPYFKYYIILGSFKQRYLAESLLKNVEKKGYKAALINFRNGFNAVGVCPSNDRSEAIKSLGKIRKEVFCPADVWILVN